MTRLFLHVLALCLLFIAGPASAGASGVAYRETTLPNGLRVIVARGPSDPQVTARLMVKSGAWADPPGLAGTAVMAAGMLTDGTSRRDAQAIARDVAALDAKLAGSGGLEASVVTLQVRPGDLEPALLIMAEVIRHPAYRPEALDARRKWTFEGLAAAYGEPGGLGYQVGAPVIFAGTPLGHAAEGTAASLPRLQAAGLAEFHAKHYRPDNAVLVLAGDIAPEQAFALAAQAFGTWTSPPGPPPKAPAITPRAPPWRGVVDLPGVSTASVRVIARAVSRDDPRYYMALVANAVLGGEGSGRLSRAAAGRAELGEGASSVFSARRTTGYLSANLAPQSVAVPEALELIRVEMSGLSANPVAQDELAARKGELIAGYSRQLLTTRGLAVVIGDLALFDLPLGEIDALPAGIEAVTAKQVQAFAKQVLDPARANIIIVGDAQAFAPALTLQTPAMQVLGRGDLDLDAPDLRAAR